MLPRQGSSLGDVVALFVHEFVEFIGDITRGKSPPEIIEIHPPFADACNKVSEFLDVYEQFEKEITRMFPDVIICIENRSGSQYTKSKFLISTLDDIRSLLSEVDARGIKLKMAVDYPQLFTSYHKDPKDIPMNWFENEHSILETYKEMISSIHLWGKNRNSNGRLVAHNGDLNTLFDMDSNKKEGLLKLISSFYDDGVCRYFVPEVNSCDRDLHSIIEDCVAAGMTFSGEYYI